MEGFHSGSCAVIEYYPTQFRLIFCLLFYSNSIFLLLVRCSVVVRVIVFVLWGTMIMICHPYIILILMLSLLEKKSCFIKTFQENVTYIQQFASEISMIHINNHIFDTLNDNQRFIIVSITCYDPE